MKRGSATEDAGDPSGVTDDLRALQAAGLAVLRQFADTFSALRALLRADMALARSAVVGALVLASTGVLFGVIGLLLATALVVACLVAYAGLSWPAALVITLAGALLLAVLAGLLAWRSLRDANFAATRRQLARMRGREPDPDMPEPPAGSGDASAPAAASAPGPGPAVAEPHEGEVATAPPPAEGDTEPHREPRA
ncbi:phage holin family protein [Coralloluteibacterium stylophorae]|uniref:Phage holin family protein n=1 Tax=Coralloluteibacterium stylophorae TaxID=1776034 RepID=A0A8J7VR02_9GAMM|nr:phage holin family protein [Coralloluteibacterium stylophorae]MBS7458225.1 phage holin family protein [Coralloluteibacterium stylophorae]